MHLGQFDAKSRRFMLNLVDVSPHLQNEIIRFLERSVQLVFTVLQILHLAFTRVPSHRILGVSTNDPDVVDGFNELPFRLGKAADVSFQLDFLPRNLSLN